jgi:uncharacterized protein involved in exopolysaccharide biosynthesis
MSPAAPLPSIVRAPLRFRWGVFVTVLILSAVVVAVVWALWPPRYSAAGQVIVESPFLKPPMQLSEPPAPLGIMDRTVAGQVQRLKGESLLRDLATNDQRVRDTAWFKSGPDASERLEDLRNGIRVRQVPRTNFITITFNTKKPEDAPVIVNQLIDKYIAQTASAGEIRYKSDRDTYLRHEREIKNRMQEIQNQQLEFLKLELSEPGVTQGINVVGAAWRVLEEEAARIGVEKLQYQAAYENLQALESSHFALAPQARAMIEQDPLVARLQELKLMEELEIEATQGQPPATLPAAAARKSRLDAIDRKLSDLIAARETEAFKAELSRTELQYLNAMKAEQQLLDRIEQLKARQRDLDRQMATYQSREAEYKLLQEQLGRVTDYISQLQMLINTSGATRVSAVRAAVPLQPDPKPLPALAGAGLAAALLVGIPLSFTRRPRKEPQPSDSRDSRRPQG